MEADKRRRPMDTEDALDSVRRADSTARHYSDDPDDAAVRAAEKAKLDPEMVAEARRLAYRRETSVAEELAGLLGHRKPSSRTGRVW
jgi:hypothetical protein